MNKLLGNFPLKRIDATEKKWETRSQINVILKTQCTLNLTIFLNPNQSGSSNGRHAARVLFVLTFLFQ